MSLALVFVLTMGRNDFYTSQSMRFGSNPVSTMAQGSPTPVYKSAAARTFGKENARLSESPLRGVFSTNVYPQHFFHDQIFNPLYHHSHTHSFHDLSESTLDGDFKPANMGLSPRPLRNFYGAYDAAADVDHKTDSPFDL